MKRRKENSSDGSRGSKGEVCNYFKQKPTVWQLHTENPQVPWEENWLEAKSWEHSVCMRAHVFYLQVQGSGRHVGGVLRECFY